MHYFDVHSNTFQGSIPSELDGLHSVEYLYLDHNQLAAQAPPAARLHCQSPLPTPTTIPTAHLHCLGALHDGLTLTLTLPLPLTLTLTLTLPLILTLTQVPFTVGNLSLLKDLRLSHNLLTGEIPPTLGRLELLVSLSIDNNQVSSTQHVVSGK